MRSAIHPALFSLVYKAADVLAGLLSLDSATRTEVLLAAPKTLQACFAALGDFYTWKLARYVYGTRSIYSLTALVLTIVSPWQWFTSTRTFANSLETTLTIVALYNWPWHWSSEVVHNTSRGEVQTAGLRIRDDGLSAQEKVDEVTRLRRALLCAALATILRPTNILIWASLTYFTFVRDYVRMLPTWLELATFLRETLLCGGIMLLVSTVVDRAFYEAWVFPPYTFLQVNVVQSLATFYGNNDWHYYISQGYPLLLTTALPFTLIGLYRSLVASANSLHHLKLGARNILYLLSIVSLLVPAAFSNIAHKEVRFIYPLLPALHVISAEPLASFFRQLMLTNTASRAQRPTTFPKQLLFFVLLSINVCIAYYTSQIHNSGIIGVTTHIRQEFSASYQSRNMTVGMLMPCHSTPWRSHIQYPASESTPGIHAWALTCEPPLNLNASEKAAYLDEADLFYADPSAWLKRHMARDPPIVTRIDGSTGTASSFAPGFFAEDYRSKRLINIPKTQMSSHPHPHPHPGTDSHSDSVHPPLDGNHHHDDHPWWTTRHGRRPWPDYLLFFAQLEPTLQSALRGSGYMECRRIFNSHWHDDGRRQGDVVVWCLDERRAASASTSQLHPETENEADMVRSRWWPWSWAGRQGPRRRAGAPTEGAHRPGAEDNTGPPKSIATPLDRVVEKPYWKVRPPAPDP